MRPCSRIDRGASEKFHIFGINAEILEFGIGSSSANVI
jgi:hypothetical protein